MSIYNRALRDAPKVDRRIVRAVNLVSVALPVAGGVFGLEDVWKALQALAKKEHVPLDVTHAGVSKALDALSVAGILSHRGGGYVVKPPGDPAPTRAAPKKPAPEKDRSAALYEKMEALRAAAREPEPIAAPVVEVVEEHAEPEAAPPEVVIRHNEAAIPVRQVLPPIDFPISVTVETIVRHPPAASVAAVVEEALVVEAEPHKAEPEPPKARKGPRARPEIKAAAEAGALPPRNQAVLDLLQAGPMTTANICAALGESSSSTRCRLHRLREAGLIKKVGQVDAHDRAPMTIWGLASALGTPQVPSQPAAAVEVPAPVRDRLWTARAKNGPDGHGRWYWEARATVGDDRRSRGLGWLAPGEALAALQEHSRPSPADLQHTGPAWPNLHSLDVDRDEAAIAEIERRCAAWRVLLRAAREVAA